MSLHLRLKKLEQTCNHAAIRAALTEYSRTGELPANAKAAEICLRVTAAIAAMVALRSSDHS